MAKSIIVGATGTASATNTFLGPCGAGAGYATEIDQEYAITHSCQITNLRRFISSGGSGSNTLKSRKNGADGNLIVTASGTGAAVDTTHTDTFVPGDVWAFGITHDGTDPVYRISSCNVEMTGQTGTFFRSGASTPTVLDLASTTRYFSISGFMQSDGVSSEVNAQWRNRGYSQLSAFQVRISANARVNDTTFAIRVNSSNVATVVVAAGQTGLFLVTDIAQSLATGDLLSIAATTGTGIEAITIAHVGATLLSSSNATECFAATPNSVSRTASATANYMTLGGGVSVSATSPTGLNITPGFATDVRNLRIRVNLNTCTSDVIVTLFVNGVSSGMTTTITAAGTGWFENTVDKVFIDADDEICLEIVGGTANSLTITAVGVTLAVPTPVNPSVTTKPRLSGGGMGSGPKRRVRAWPALSLIEHD